MFLQLRERLNPVLLALRKKPNTAFWGLGKRGLEGTLGGQGAWTHTRGGSPLTWSLKLGRLACTRPSSVSEAGVKGAFLQLKVCTMAGIVITQSIFRQCTTTTVHIQVMIVIDFPPCQKPRLLQVAGASISLSQEEASGSSRNISSLHCAEAEITLAFK